jgi:hypothetical protein
MGGAFRDAMRKVHLGRARPSYNRVSPAAQFRQLSRSAAGRKALGLSGVSVSDRTARRWLTRQQAPSKANQAAIARAYDAARQGGIPEWVRRGKMRITGEVQHGADRRVRGQDGREPLLVDLTGGDKRPVNDQDYPQPTIWDAIEDALDNEDDDYLDELIGEELLPADDDLGGYEWGFPGGAYSVSVSG